MIWIRAIVRVAGRGPAPALLAASAVGWIAMVWTQTDSAHAGHLTRPSAFGVLSAWLAMVLAMSPPLLIREVGRVWRGSLRRRRSSLVVVFVSGYGAAWLAAGVVSVLARPLVPAPPPALVIAGVLLWLSSPARQRALNACHRVPTLRAFGAAASRDAVGYGLSTGLWCLVACGPIMLTAMLATGHHLLAMSVAAVLVTAERYQPARRPAWRVPFTPGQGAGWPVVAGLAEPRGVASADGAS